MIDKFIKLYKKRNYIIPLIDYVKVFYWKITYLTILDILNSIISILLAILSKHLIDNAIGNVKEVFILVLVLYAFLSVFRIFLRAYTNYIRQLYTTLLTNENQKKIIYNYFKRKWIDANSYHTGDVITRITKDVATLTDFYTVVIPSAVSLIVQFVLAFVVIVQYDVLLAIYGFAIVPVISLLSLNFTRKIRPLQDRINSTESKYRSYVSEIIQNSLIIRVFQNENRTMSDVEDIQNEKISLIKARNITIIGVNFMISSGYTISSIIALGFGTYRISLGLLSFGTFTAVLQLISRMQTPIMSMAKLIPKYISATAAYDRCEQFNSETITKFNYHPRINTVLGVKVNNIHFKYNSKVVLSNINLTINPREKIAIIGASGIGKTTLLHLLMDIIEPLDGEIRPFSSSLQYRNSSSFYTYVPQGNTTFSGTIRQNLCFGKLDISNDKLFDVLKVACANDFVKDLPKGIDTELGENGLGLSEGQLQRICIARSLLRDAPIILLDEATSALDKRIEEKVIENIYNAYPNKTVIAITHRPSILKYVDRIIEISDEKKLKEYVN